MKELVLLVADKNAQFALKGALARPKALGIRPIEFEFRVHPNVERRSANDEPQPLHFDIRKSTIEIRMSEELKKRTKKFALDIIELVAGVPQVLETRHAIGQVIRSSSSVAANYRSACRGKSKADFIAKLGTVEEEADETGFWLEMLRDIAQRRRLKLEAQASQELTRLLDEANQLVAITVASRKTARGGE